MGVAADLCGLIRDHDGPALRVTALVRDRRHRILLLRRPDGAPRPGTWEPVVADVPVGTTAGEALRHAVTRSTGWTVRAVEPIIEPAAPVPNGSGRTGRPVRRELRFLVTAAQAAAAEPAAAPDLTGTGHDAFTWAGLGDTGWLRSPGTVADPGLTETVVKAARTRLTRRLRLEPIGPEHGTDLWRLHARPEVADWLGGAWTRESGRRSVLRLRAGWDAAGFGTWAAYDRDDGELVGRGGIAPYVLDGRSTHEIGWTVRPERWGRGYATEMGAAGLVLAFTELGAREVVAFTLPHNARSRAVMDRLGMRFAREVPHAGMRHVLYVVRPAAVNLPGQMRPEAQQGLAVSPGHLGFSGASSCPDRLS
ncbi:Protein N-acetyltransferase, RimJ/RimL family [Actinopolymorpha cephalotaxi]|uniref:Protein N-acetyltransferase, RimJ/RimL family n=1 Tax=Actinopolymorpha cephalotaxi TaxID=504797 RepID=A0A1I2U3H0_9ACTN|nr:GNAT family N-acetyltransferase [Actinopolymorpha cephalotaxi]NYH86427.1 RimJ/RimL family protein N-acetyltransferase [Actinopolymorpha cephalotaxi]SFG71700.1 Protein N-acetyltransferase, RimJ/RimL family [Actinopolymorpha cephalotaxi]